MAKAVSKRVTGSQQDVLAGTVVGTLPQDAPFYDVEVRVAQVLNTTTGSTPASSKGRITLLMNGLSVLNNALTFKSFDVVSNVGGTARTQYAEPFSDGPSALFRAPGGARLTLNLTSEATGSVYAVYVEARETNSPAPLGIGHVDLIQLDSSGSSLDVLSGTNAGQVPNVGNLWQLTVQARQVAAVTSTGQSNLTMLVDSETLCENFVLPISTTNDVREFSEVLVSSLVTPNSRITLNAYADTQGNDIFYRVFMVPFV